MDRNSDRSTSLKAALAVAAVRHFHKALHTCRKRRATAWKLIPLVCLGALAAGAIEAVEPTRSAAVARTVPGAVAPCYQRTHPSHGMADAREYGLRVAEGGFDEKRGERKRREHCAWGVGGNGRHSY